MLISIFIIGMFLYFYLSLKKYSILWVAALVGIFGVLETAITYFIGSFFGRTCTIESIIFEHDRLCGGVGFSLLCTAVILLTMNFLRFLFCKFFKR